MFEKKGESEREIGLIEAVYRVKQKGRKNILDNHNKVHVISLTVFVIKAR